jgi:hypothetical protein
LRSKDFSPTGGLVSDKVTVIWKTFLNGLLAGTIKLMAITGKDEY